MDYFFFGLLFAFLVFFAIPTLFNWTIDYGKNRDAVGFVLAIILLTFCCLFAFTQFLFFVDLFIS